jgi:methionyl-tRNA synthetase
MNAEHAVFVTTPIYYVNDTPHVGHAYTTVLADCVTRFHRLFGCTTHLSVGTDEHGQKALWAARNHGITPQQHVDRTSRTFARLWHALRIDYTWFVRTTAPAHVQAVTEALGQLHRQGDIYQGAYEGWYCVPCERFWRQPELRGGFCPDCNRAVERVSEPAWFFRQSAHQRWLIDHIESHPDFIRPDIRRNETLGFLRAPLTDLCISRPRSRLPWGIPLPFDPAFVCYVWFDALLNYLSVLGYPADRDAVHRSWPATLQLVGKDILTTHTVYWPIILHALGFKPPRTVFAHGWWLGTTGKISKSAGNAVDPVSLVDSYGSDAIRWFLLAEPSHGQDCRFSPERLDSRYRCDLAGGIGNFANRVFALAQRYSDATIPVRTAPAAGEESLREAILGACVAIPDQVYDIRLDCTAQGILAVISTANRWLQEQAPWLEPSAEKRARVAYAALETLRILTVLLDPITPGKAHELRAGFGPAWPQSPPWPVRWGQLQPGTALAQAPILFPRQPQGEPTLDFDL